MRRRRMNRARTLGAFAAGHGRCGAIHRDFVDRVAKELARGLKQRAAHAAAGRATANKFRCNPRTVQRALSKMRTIYAEAAPQFARVASMAQEAQQQLEFIRAQLTVAELAEMADWTLPQAYAFALERQQLKAAQQRVRELERKLTRMTARSITISGR
jgi:hypothetical protein